MTTVSIVYHSNSGHTSALAEAVARGAAAVDGTEVRLLRILPEHLVSGRYRNDALMSALDESDAFIFGAPTFMGSISAVFKAFMEATFALWFEQRWKDKVASGFTNSASQSGDKLSSLMQLVLLAAQLSMMWVSLEIRRATIGRGEVSMTSMEFAARLE